MGDPAGAAARAAAEITNEPLRGTDLRRHARPGLRYAIPRGGWSYSRPGPVTLPAAFRPRPRTIEVPIHVYLVLDEPERQRYIAQAAKLARLVEGLRLALAISSTDREKELDADLHIANEATFELTRRCVAAEAGMERERRRADRAESKLAQYERDASERGVRGVDFFRVDL